jgi:hypothetical protein
VVNLLDHLRTQPQRPSSLAAAVPSDPTRSPTVVWTNLREGDHACGGGLVVHLNSADSSLHAEPIIYVNNRPFVVRQQDLPFNNLEITGIEPDEVEAMEQRLKADILQVRWHTLVPMVSPVAYPLLFVRGFCYRTPLSTAGEF